MKIYRPVSNPAGQDRSKYTGIQVLSLFLLALCLRLVFYALSSDYPLLHIQSLDEAYYLEFGKNLARGEWRGNIDGFYMDPLYGYFLGLIFFLFGDDLFFVRLAQIFLDAFNVIIIFAIGRRVWNREAGFIAALIWAAYGVSFYYSLLILKVTLGITGMLLFVLLVMKVAENPKIIGFFLAGMAGGMLTYIRANFVLVIPFTMILYYFEKGSNWRKRSNQLLFFLAGAMVLFISAAGLNHLMIGHSQFLITSSGRILYSCNNPENTSGRYDVPTFSRSHPTESEEDFHKEAENRLGRTLSAKEASTYWRNETFRVLRDHPRLIPVLLINKCKWTLANYEIPMNQSYQFMAEFAGTDQWPLLNYAFVLALGLPGLILGLTRHRRAWWLLVPILTIVATLMMFCVSSRFRMPMTPFFTVGAGIFLQCVWTWIKEGRRRKIILPVIFAAALFAVSMAISPPESDGYKETGLAKAFYLRNDYENAKTLASDIMKYHPQHADLYIILGRIAKSEGQMEQAAAHYHDGLSVASDHFTINYDLGMLYMEAGKYEQAVAHLEKSLSIRRYITGMLNLALAYEKTGDWINAAQYYREFMKSAGSGDSRYGFAKLRLSAMEDQADSIN
jgi:tetratricopeptide (TPR) repeat protein